jgi:hypothetical protein
MLQKKEPGGDKPIFSPERVKELNKLMRDKVAEVERLQKKGELPFCSIIQRCHVKRRDVMEILGIESAQAGRVMAKARKKANKKRGQYLSVKELADATELDEHTIQRALDMCPIMRFKKEKK